MKLVLAAFLFLIFNGCATKQEEPKTESAVVTNTTDKNKELIRRVYTDMANKRNYALIDSFFAPNIFDHGALPGQEQGREGFKKAVTEFLNMFSQLEIKSGRDHCRRRYGCHTGNMECNDGFQQQNTDRRDDPYLPY